MGKVTSLNILFDVRSLYEKDEFAQKIIIRIIKLLSNLKGVNLFYLLEKKDAEKELEDIRVHEDKKIFTDTTIDFIDIYISMSMMLPSNVENNLEITKYAIMRDIVLNTHGNAFAKWYEESLQIYKNNYDYFITFNEKLKDIFLCNSKDIQADKVIVLPLGVIKDENKIFEKKEIDIKKRDNKKRYYVAVYSNKYGLEIEKAVKGFINYLKRNDNDDYVDIFTLIKLKEDDIIDQYIEDIFNSYKTHLLITNYNTIKEQDILENVYAFVDTFWMEDFNFILYDEINYGNHVISNTIIEKNDNFIINVKNNSLDYEEAFNKLNNSTMKENVHEEDLYAEQKIARAFLENLIEIENLKRDKPVVTIVTITYNLIKANRENTIKQCIQSVHDQSYPNIEHIIIDGASDDGTLELLKPYEEKGWIHIYSEEDNGLYDAMNKGIYKARGEYVSFLNSDDFYHDNLGVEKTVMIMKKNKADYSFSDTNILNEDGSTYNWIADIGNILYARNYCHQSMFVRLSVLKELGGFDLQYRVSSDSDLMIRILEKNYSYAKCNYPFVTYRGGGLSAITAEESRRDHSYSFYIHLGSKLGLTNKDCYELWQYRFLDEMSVEQQARLVSKIPSFFNSEMIMNEFVRRHSNGKKINFKQYIAKIIPFKKLHITRKMRVQNGQNEMVYYFCNKIPIWITKEKL